ncbi:baseplate J/gp47 family protein [Roseicella sp. DB1501]|uniref:baseplate J/gp47 family protein n=1 Tax=Roseicella sp. DB1501 TaxID=2730925 RepID=UPI001491EF68|nr:baseplate J/gp47 family protein [Roseicella sp. DB1501]NOG69822.1 baseplate J/gp47 family protein [Roseicella sp. DB1501]
MPYARSSLSALQNQAVTDVAAALPTGMPLFGSVLRILATAMAGLIHGTLGYLDWIAKQSVPFTATQESLEGWAALKGVIRIPATQASGTATFTGTPGYALPAGTILVRGDSVQYTTAADLTLTGTSGSVAITASVAGAAGNAAVGSVLTLQSAVAGIVSAGSVSTAVVGGADAESDTAFRTRMLLAYSAPAQGGSQSDYVNWTLAVPGVTRAWCLPNASGPGTVTVWACLDAARASFNGLPQGSTGSATLETRSASATGDQLMIADALYPLRPATALVTVAAPATQNVNVTLTSLSPYSAQVVADITTALKQLFLTIGSPLGTKIYPSDIADAIEGVVGGGGHFILSPTSAVTIATGSIPVLGTLTASA